MNALLHDPLFMLAVFLAFAGVGSSLILGCVLLHLRTLNCKRVDCVHHPRSSKGHGSFDPSSIKTPDDLLAHPRDAAGSGTVLSSATNTDDSPSATDTDAMPFAWTVWGSEANSSFDPRSLDCRDSASAGLDAEDVEVEEPRERPPMDFTNDMVMQVCRVLERQHALEQQAIERRQLLERQRMLELRTAERQQARAARRQAGKQRPHPTRLIHSQQPESGQAIRSEQAPRGRHFKPAPSTRGSGENVAPERLAYHRPAEMRHARSGDVDGQLRRVS